MFGFIAGMLLALLALGLIATLFVKLTEAVGRYIMRKVRESRRKHALAGMKKVIDQMNKEATQDQREKIAHELSAEDMLMWREDNNGEVDENSIELVHGEQVDQKTRSILDAHDNLVYINPTAV